MGIPIFFDFYSKSTPSIVRAHPVILDGSTQKNGKFDYKQLILGNYDGFDFPLTFKQDRGVKLHDILDTGYVSLFLISDNLRTLLEENNLTGWKTFPIKLLDKKGNEILGYQGFSITGLCGPIDYTKCDKFQKKIVEGGSLWTFYKGLYVGLDKWDGSDFFRPEGNLAIIVSSRTSEILKKHKISNLELQNLADIETDEGIVELPGNNFK